MSAALNSLLLQQKTFADKLAEILRRKFEVICRGCRRKAVIRSCQSGDYGYPGQRKYRRFLRAFASSWQWNRSAVRSPAWTLFPEWEASLPDRLPGRKSFRLIAVDLRQASPNA